MISVANLFLPDLQIPGGEIEDFVISLTPRRGRNTSVWPAGPRTILAAVSNAAESRRCSGWKSGIYETGIFIKNQAIRRTRLQPGFGAILYVSHVLAFKRLKTVH